MSFMSVTANVHHWASAKFNHVGKSTTWIALKGQEQEGDCGDVTLFIHTLDQLDQLEDACRTARAFILRGEA